MNVLSLFDGMSCGQIALNRANIKYDKYYASEIDKNAIQVTQKNYPDTIQLGDVTKWQDWDLPKIDLILAGSPCQGFSIAGKKLNFEDPRSKLFFEFVDILKHYKPKYFLLENVVMLEEHNDVISSMLGEIYPECVQQMELFRTGRLEPIMINSSLLSAQSRKRLYWTNIPNVTMPEDKGILLKDIVHESSEDVLSEDIIKMVKKNIVPFDKSLKILDKEVETGKVGYFKTDSQANRVYYIHDKAVTLCGEAGGGAAKMGQYLFGALSNRVEDISINENGDIRPHRNDDRKSGISEIGTVKNIESDKSNTLIASQNHYIHTLFQDTKKNPQGDRVYTEEEKACTLNASSGGTAGSGNMLFGVTKRFCPLDKHNSKDGIVCVGGLDGTKRWGSDGKNLQRNFSQGERVYSQEGKSPTISANSGGTAGKSALIFGCLTPDREEKRQAGQRFSEGSKFYTLTAQDNHGIFVDGYIRKLTPIECERLQTVPDNYTAGVSDAQRYKMLGNGWTVDVIVCILKNIKDKV